MPKQAYRSEMGKIHAILDVTANGGDDGVLVSIIAHKANLTHDVVVDSCYKLAEAGLIEMTRRGRNRIMTMTQKGFCFFLELQRFKKLVESMNLRC